MRNPKVSVVVCTYNGAGRIKSLLDSLKKQTYKNLEIIIVDDGSTDGTSDIVKKYPFKRITHEGNNNKGLADSRNKGVEVSKGDIIVFTDDDCVADKNWIKEIAKCYQKNPSVNGVGGKIKPYSLETLFEKYDHYARHPIFFHPTYEYNRKERIRSYLGKMFSMKKKTLKDGQKLSAVMGLNSSYKKDIIKEVGMHEPGLRRGVDFDLNMKLRKEGILNAVYCDRAIIYHKHRIGFKAFVKHVFDYGKAYMKVWRLRKEVKWLPRPLPLLFILFFPIGYFINVWYLPLVVILFYYLKDLPYTLFTLKSLSLFITMPIIDFIREFFYLIGNLWGLLK